VTQLLALLTIGERALFDDFERQAAAIMAEHGVRIEKTFAVGPEREAHVVAFAREADFQAYRSDPRLAALASTRSRGIVATDIYRAAVPDRWHGPAQVYAELIARHCEPHRRYHTVQHLDECFLALDQVQPHSPDVELALWFHDAIYDTHRADNEALSAALARDTALGLGVAPGPAQRIADLILCTRHAVEPEGLDAEALVDVDLSILGAASARFDEYECQVRREYSWVPEETFRKRRAEVLRQFLARSHIYSTRAFRERYEPAARANLARSLEALGESHG
jgi:predicted metal-dependent HD superfamily phosphohydrolase